MFKEILENSFSDIFKPYTQEEFEKNIPERARPFYLFAKNLGDVEVKDIDMDWGYHFGMGSGLDLFKKLRTKLQNNPDVEERETSEQTKRRKSKRGPFIYFRFYLEGHPLEAGRLLYSKDSQKVSIKFRRGH